MYYLKRNGSNWDIYNTQFQHVQFQHVIEQVTKGVVFAIDSVRALNKENNEDCPVVMVLSSYEDIQLSEIINNKSEIFTTDDSLLQLATNWGNFIPNVPFWAVETKNERIMFCSSYKRAKKVYDELIIKRLKNK